jgi:hypothetical protein
MRRGLRITLLVLCCLLLVGAVVLLLVYRASQQVPEFYLEAMAGDAAAQRKASDRMVEQTARLNNNLRNEGRWQAAFSAEDINGWLAVELPRANPPVLPPQIHDPRADIEPDGVTVAARAERGGFSTVVSLKMDVYLESANVLALRIRSARAGAVPWPLGQVVQNLTKAARHADFQLQWRQAGGDPVAVLTIPPLRRQGKEAKVDAVRLEKGQIVVSGNTERRK